MTDKKVLAEALLAVGPDLKRVADGLQLVANLAGDLLGDDAKVQAENRTSAVFDRQRKLAIENARRGNFILSHAPITDRRAG